MEFSDLEVVAWRLELDPCNRVRHLSLESAAPIRIKSRREATTKGLVRKDFSQVSREFHTYPVDPIRQSKGLNTFSIMPEFVRIVQKN